MTATATVDRRTALETHLERLSEAGVITTHSAGNPTGRKLVWRVAAGEAVLLDSASTAEVELFLSGVEHGRRHPITGSGERRMREPHQNRRAIIEEGETVVRLDSPDADELKRARNGLFTHGYALGLKGSFTVETTREGDTVILRAFATDGIDAPELVAGTRRLAARGDE